MALSSSTRPFLLWTYPPGGTLPGRQFSCKYQGHSHYLLLSRCRHYWSVELMICNELSVTHVSLPLLSRGPLTDSIFIISFAGKLLNASTLKWCGFACCVVRALGQKMHSSGFYCLVNVYYAHQHGDAYILSKRRYYGQGSH